MIYFYFLFIFVFVCVHMHVCAHVHVCQVCIGALPKARKDMSSREAGVTDVCKMPELDVRN